MKSLTKAQILEVDDIQKEWVDVPEWGGGVYIKVLSGTERDGFEASVFIQRGKENPEVVMTNMRAKLCARAICNEDGKRIFATKEVELLGRKSGKALDRIFTKAQEINGMTKKDIDDLVKNLPSGQNGSDGSSLPQDLDIDQSDMLNDQ